MWLHNQCHLVAKRTSQSEIHILHSDNYGKCFRGLEPRDDTVYSGCYCIYNYLVKLLALIPTVYFSQHLDKKKCLSEALLASCLDQWQTSLTKHNWSNRNPLVLYLLLFLPSFYISRQIEVNTKTFKWLKSSTWNLSLPTQLFVVSRH
jgi:hypothetical protein